MTDKNEQETPDIITIRKIAEEARVSLATVSRVLNKKRNVSPDLAAKVLEAAAKYDYRPSPAARFMQGQRTGIIGLIIPDISLSFFGDLAEGAIKAARQYDQVIVISSSGGKRDIETVVIDQLSRSVLDGLIYCPVASGEPLPAAEAFRNLPVVIVGRRGAFPDRPHVYSDNRKGGYLSTRYLVNLGRSRIAFMAGFWDPPCTEHGILKAAEHPKAGSYSSLDRFSGYLEALREAGIPYDPSLVVISGYDNHAGYSAAHRLVGRKVDVDAILVPNAYTAEGTMRLFRERAIRVPSDVSVFSFDDGGLAPILSIPVTALQHDMRLMGKCAIESLHSLLAGKPTADTVLDVNFIIRESTAIKMS